MPRWIVEPSLKRGNYWSLSTIGWRYHPPSRTKNGGAQVGIEKVCPRCDESYVTWKAKPAAHCSKQCAQRAAGVGGRTVTAQGYIRLLLDPLNPDHTPYLPMSQRTGKDRTTYYIPEHRFVMAKHLGRCLTSKESVHHINGDRADNRLENLQLWASNHGNGVAFKCRTCGSNDIEHLELDRG